MKGHLEPGECTELAANLEETTDRCDSAQGDGKNGVLERPAIVVNDAVTRHFFDNRETAGHEPRRDPRLTVHDPC